MMAARIGGDEFALLLEQCSHEAAVRVAEDIVASISAIALPWLSGSLQIGASIGVASLTPGIDTVDAWVDAADAACYAAKAAGRGVVRVGRPPLEPDAPRTGRTPAAPGTPGASSAPEAPDGIED
jgi:diguanylate cyclase (GGDEF)-like protein